MNARTRSQTYANALRARATAAERELCRLLDARMVSYVFQSNMWSDDTGTVFIADFRIKRSRHRPAGMPKKQWRSSTHLAKLFVEVDGSYHIGRGAYDARRTRWIEEHRGAIVIRFTNEDVFQRPLAVLAEIEKYGVAYKTVRVSPTSPQA